MNPLNGSGWIGAKDGDDPITGLGEEGVGLIRLNELGFQNYVRSLVEEDLL